MNGTTTGKLVEDTRLTLSNGRQFVRLQTAGPFWRLYVVTTTDDDDATERLTGLRLTDETGQAIWQGVVGPFSHGNIQIGERRKIGRRWARLTLEESGL